MWRAIPLAKIVLGMIIVCTIFSVVLSLLMVLIIESEKTEPTPTIFIEQFFEREINHGVRTGVLTGLAMAFYAIVDRWTIRKLAHFRVGLLTVAAMVSFLNVGGSFHITHLAPDGSSLLKLIVMTIKHPVLITQPYTILVLFGAIAKYAAIGLTVLYVAGGYWREASAHLRMSVGEASALSSSPPADATSPHAPG